MDITLIGASLNALNLSPSEYTFLMCYSQQKEYPFSDKDVVIASLQSKLYIKLDENGLIRPRFKMEEFEQHLEDGNPNAWIDEWRELFPKGVKSGGRSIKGDKQGCIRKMNTFVRNNPKITKDEIFEATKMYIFEKGRDHYRYMMCADYFISKDGSSTLAGLIESIAENGNEFKDMEEGTDDFETVI